MKFFHYLFEAHPGVGDVMRRSDKSVGIALPAHKSGEVHYELPIAVRDQRVLVVIDGELLWDSVPKSGDLVSRVEIGDFKTNADHLRKPRFGVPSYCMETAGGKEVAILKLERLFLLLPAGNSVFRRFRDLRSFNPSYVFVDVKKTKDGPSVAWHNSTY